MRRLVWLICAFSAPALALDATPEARSLAPAPPAAPELLVPPGHPQSSSSFHPRVVLSDAAGKLVRDSGQPVDTLATCGHCHDVKWIAEHGFHFTRAQPAAGVIAPKSAAMPEIAPNCFFCHVRHANVKAARDALAAGAPQWVATATLAGSSLITTSVATPTTFAYAATAFAADGSVSAEQLQLGPPSNQACGSCHGIVSRYGPELEDWLTQPELTLRTGQIFSPARVVDSSINLKDRDRLARPWDIHAERLLNCSDCHFAPNDPRARAVSKPPADTLRFEPRHAGISAFLQKPSHEFAHRRDSLSCESCHQANQLHNFLPHVLRHLEKVACATCHIPKSLVPALAELNAAVPAAPGQPARTYRGIAGDIRDPGSFVAGFVPAYVLRKTPAGVAQFMPVNWVVHWTWQDISQGDTVAETALNRALFDAQG